ncbi:unnamed protein product [Adineta ricciae]|uniref:Uncharacterized protein n=1 Tax=Adineta ricciae TaxID=249248 RepID=A0A815XLB6_ADIRI|nr:unnamed protein product [Adineta ricciae]CAF1558883.1 unnamed protein product [Adineta ricciae]
MGNEIAKRKNSYTFDNESHRNRRRYLKFLNDDVPDIIPAESEHNLSDTESEQIRSEARRYSFTLLSATLPVQ